VGGKAKLSSSLTWNVIDIWGFSPLSDAPAGDPRQEGDIAYTSSLKYNF
jgi:hypothetical protein